MRAVLALPRPSVSHPLQPRRQQVGRMTGHKRRGRVHQPSRGQVLTSRLREGVKGFFSRPSAEEETETEICKTKRLGQMTELRKQRAKLWRRPSLLQTPLPATLGLLLLLLVLMVVLSLQRRCEVT